MNKLIVALPWSSRETGQSDATSNSNLLASKHEYLFVVCNDSRTVLQSGQATLELLPKTDVTVLVAPIQALSWHQIALPKVPKAQIRAVVDGQLEELLLDDAGMCAIALSPNVQFGNVGIKSWVATCNKAWLSKSISIFETAGHRVIQVAPALAPDQSGAEPCIYVTGTTDEAYFTALSSKGILTVPVSKHTQTLAPNLSNSLKLFIPNNAIVLSEPAVASLAETMWGRPVQIRQQSVGLIESADTNWELAQFDLKLSGDGDGIKRLRRHWFTFWKNAAWRPARWGLIGILLANITGLNAWSWKQKSDLENKQTLLTEQLTQTFPQIKVVVDPMLQMSKEINTLRQSTGTASSQSFESVLTALSQNTKTNTPPAMIEYKANKTILTGLNWTSAEYEQAQSKMKAIGYTLSRDGNRIIISTEFRS